MRRSGVKFVIALLLMIGLVGCTKKIDPASAAKAFVNTEFYLKDYEEYQKAFGVKVDQDSEDFAKDNMAKNLEVFGFDEGATNDIADAFLKVIKEKTSITVKDVTTKGDQAKVVLMIKGLDRETFKKNVAQLKEKELINRIKEAGMDNVSSVADLQNLGSKDEENQVNQVIAELSQDTTAMKEVLIEGLKVANPATQEKEVKMTLIVDEKDKSYWKVKDKEAVRKNITQCLFPVS